MSQPATTVTSATRKVDPQLAALLTALTPGQRIRVTQRVRVGARVWTTEARGQFRGVNYLATGLTTDRVPEDDVVVPTVHFEKADGELASVSLDENTKVVRLA